MRIGACDVEFIPVTHSVPESMAIAFHTPQGVILHSGDFKLDLQPVDGRRTDMPRMGELARTEGIRLLLSDSTNAEEPGFTESESSVGVTLRRVFAAQPGKRIIVACFASHMHRVQQIIDAAVATGRKVATLGRSMGKNVELGMRLGIISIPDGVQVDIEDVDDLSPGEVCVISTGSQGEPMSALSLMADGGEQVAAHRRGRRRDHQRPPHPGQRVVGGPGDRRPAPPGRRGGPLGGRSGPRERARPPGRAADDDRR